MWRGDDGVLRTVALPEPSEVFSDAALAAIEQVLEQADSEDVAGLVGRRELGCLGRRRPPLGAGRRPGAGRPRRRGVNKNPA